MYDITKRREFKAVVNVGFVILGTSLIMEKMMEKIHIII